MTGRYDTGASVLDSLKIRGTVGVAPVVVLVHGSMDRQAAFSRLVKQFPDSTTVVYDRRGYGASSAVAAPYDVDAHVSDLDRVVTATVGPEVPVVLIGHSFGGVVALTYTSRHPERVLSVGVYESPMSWEPWWSSTSGGASAVRTAHDPALAAEIFLKRFIGERRWNELPEPIKERRRAEGHVLVSELSDIRARRPYSFGEISRPVVSAVGGRAADHIRRGARLLAETCSPLPLVEIEGAHHNAPFSNATEFARLVVAPTLRLAAET